MNTCEEGLHEADLKDTFSSWNHECGSLTHDEWLIHVITSENGKTFTGEGRKRSPKLRNSHRCLSSFLAGIQINQ